MYNIRNPTLEDFQLRKRGEKMRRMNKIILSLSILVIAAIFFVIEGHALTINHETYQTVEMVGKYQIAFATSANVAGAGSYIHDELVTNTPLRLEGDEGGRISLQANSGLIYGGGGNSSSSILSKPTDNAIITKAYLLQEAFYEEEAQDILIKFPMTLKGPRGDTFKAKSETLYTSSNRLGVCISDVTDFVRSQGFGKYEGWDIPYLPRPSKYLDQNASWKLIVICEDEKLPVRMLRLKLGSRSTSGKLLSVSIDGNGIKTKSDGNVTGQIIIGGTGGDTDWHGSHFDFKPSPNEATIRLSTGKKENVNRADNFFEGLVSHNGEIRKDVAITGYRNSDNLPIHNDDMILMDVNSIQDSKLNGHNAKFINSSPSTSLSAITENTNGNLSVFGIVADIDSAIYTSSITHSNGILKVGVPFTINASAVNNTSTAKTNLGISDGYAELILDQALSIDKNSIVATYVKANGSQSVIPLNGISISGNKVIVKFGDDGKSHVGDQLNITVGVTAKKEKKNYLNTIEVKAAGLIDESGQSNDMVSEVKVANSSDTFDVINPPRISAEDKEYWDSLYSEFDWENKLRIENVSAIDDEDGDLTSTISVISDNVQIKKPGTYKVTYSVTDSNETTATKDISVKVKYNNPPVITAKDQTFYEGQYTKDQWIKQLQKKGVTASDVEDGTITNKIKVIEDNVNPKTPGTYKVTYEVTDKYQKTTTKSVKVTVKFNNPPVITAPAKAFYESELSKSEWEKLRIKDVVASDIEDGKISKIDIVQDDVILDQSGVYNVVYRTTDQWGKSTEQTAKITVKYNNPPEITAQDQIFYEGQYTESYWKNTLRMKDVVASDTEDGNITNKIEIIEDNVNVKVLGVYYVKYKVTDAFGKSTEKQISVTVKFNNPPIIEKESINIHEGEYNEKELEKLLIEDAASEDVEDGTITNKIKIIKNDVNPSKPGSYEVTYEVTDAFGKTTIKTIDVNVIENQQPTLQIFAPSKRFIEGSITVEQWHKERMNKVTAHDREDNDLTNQITVIKDTTNVDKAGEYEVTYKVTDKWNKSTEKIAKVTVEPNEAPVIYASDKWFKTTDTVDQRAILSNVFAFDDHDGELTSAVVIASSDVQSGVAGEYKVTYKVQDRFGKHTAKQVTIHIEDYGSTPIPPKPPIVTDPEALQLWNGRELAEINITKLIEDSIFNHSDAYQDVVFGVFAAEDVVYKGEVIITKDSMIAISKVDTSGQVYAKLYHKGKYYLQELATDHHYQLDQQKYYFDFQ